MKIRQALNKDIPAIIGLLEVVNALHSDARPDIFHRATKYSESELADILADSACRPVFVAVDEGDSVMGYAFCQLQEVKGNRLMADVKTLYIDDLCVDEDCRHKGVATSLYGYVKSFAREEGVYNITLNVWAFNDGARRFYDAMGMKPMKTYMEEVL